ncbi:MAG TPA: hypothetical protein VHA82_06515 [Ramlibacter sp.]|uniref:hypothetical protein n=1 Tax=Ramlibacter sp. TaxID=1917967 RepID=UPI002B72C316|nr:hypothetical protein [Ramlibacter sp.]HVZ43448.1 hypothetical protein [Ramlibacter sp.]
MHRLRPAIAAALGLAVSWPQSSWSYLVGINPGTRSVFLQVGAGTMTGGTFNNGGTPGNNATINSVSVTVPAASLGTGSLAMSTNSNVTTSPWDGFTFCSVPQQVYVGGFYRTPGTGGNATLTVTSPANLTSGGNTISFNNISWVSGGNGDASPTIPSGTFAAGTTQTLLSIARNNWFESCLAFSYANASLAPAGTFTGRVTYTLTTP